MRIGLIAPVWIRVPPEGYGGIECVVSLLAEELVKRGHDVTLFANGLSQTSAKLEYILDEEIKEGIGIAFPDVLHVLFSLKNYNKFDLLHDHSGFIGAAMGSLLDFPFLHTLHGNFDDNSKKFYDLIKNDIYYNSISYYQMKNKPDLNYLGNVYNAVDVDSYPYQEKKDDYLAVIGRICEDKGTHTAIEVAKSLGEKLVIAGKVDPGKDIKYFEKMVLPQIDGENIIFLGEINENKKRELFSGAKCFLLPIQWDEPFGLVMVEAMACGTPVVALNRGSVAELVEDGKTGFLANSVDEMIRSIKDIGKINPRDCREYVELKFSPSIMANGYIELYSKMLSLS